MIRQPKLTNRHRGPYPCILAVVYGILFITSLVLMRALTNGKGIPNPFAPLEKSKEVFLQFPAWLGLILAAIAELSTFSLSFPTANFLLPVAGVGSFIWMVATGFSLQKNKLATRY